MALLTNKPTLPEQHVETDQLTSVATQWFHSTPVLLPVAQEQNRQFMHQTGECQHDVGYMGTLEFCPPQVNGDGRFLQSAPYYNSGSNIIKALEGYSSWQILMQMAMSLIQEFDGTNCEATILWLDHIEAIAKKTDFDPLEIGMSKVQLSVM